jgi:hypothetical protein
MQKWIHIPHPTLVDAENKLSNVVQKAFDGTPSIQPFFSVTRSGKSYLSHRVLDKFISLHEKTLYPTRIVCISAKVHMNKSDIFVRTLSALGFARLTSGKTADLEAITNARLNSLGTRVLLVDEFQHLQERGRKSTTRAILDWLKYIHDELGITVIMVGLPLAREALLMNEQLRDRSNAEITMRPYNWSDDEDRDTFSNCVATILNEIEKLGGSSPIVYDQLVRVAYFLSGGRVGMLQKLFAPLVEPNRVVSKETLKRIIETNVFAPHTTLSQILDTDISDDQLTAAHHRILEEAGEKSVVKNLYSSLASIKGNSQKCYA